jgi:hypothetical protein
MDSLVIAVALIKHLLLDFSLPLPHLVLASLSLINAEHASPDKL